MTERKPSGLDWETWIDRQIREARERGEFDSLPGTGEPFRDLGRPFDEMWWVKGKLREEGLSYLPPSLALRKEAHDALTAALRAGSEADARLIIEDINAVIRKANSEGINGPPLLLVPFDVETVVHQWRDRQGAR